MRHMVAAARRAGGPETAKLESVGDGAAVACKAWLAGVLEAPALGRGILGLARVAMQVITDD